MRPVSTRRPSQAQIQLPLLDLLAASDAPVRPVDAADRLGDAFGLPAAVRHDTAVAARGEDGTQVVQLWPRHVRFARQKLAAKGWVRSDRHRWVITDEGREATRTMRAGVVVSVWVDERTGAPMHIEVEKVCTVGGPASHHTLHLGDARDLSWLDDGVIALAAGSMPYYDLKAYNDSDAQLHKGRTYDGFLDEFERVLREVHRLLVPGGRFALNVGDVLRSRKAHGRHYVLPLHADVMVRGRQVGFDNLTPILWKKIGNLAYEQGGGGVLGKPFEPNGIIASEHEYILNLRKPGGYRKPTPGQREASRLSKADYHRYFRSVWEDIPGCSTKQGHPAPWPVEVPYRLIRMFSFVGDTVLDPFAGTFRTSEAALRAGRHSIGNEIAPAYFDLGADRVIASARELAVA